MVLELETRIGQIGSTTPFDSQLFVLRGQKAFITRPLPQSNVESETPFLLMDQT